MKNGKRAGLRKAVFCVALIGALASGASMAQQGTKLPWKATWDAGNWNEWEGFRNTTGVTIESSGCQSGRCPRAPLIANTNNDNFADYYFGDHVNVGGPKVEEVWLRFYSKFDPGYRWADRSQKLAIINLTDGITSERHYQVYLYVTPTGEYAITRSDIDNWVFNGVMQNIGTPANVRFGQWDKLKMYVRLNTPGRADGILRLWINDELKLQHTDVDIRRGTNQGMNKLILSSATTWENGGAGYQWWDSFALSHTDPDAGAVPAAPTNLRAE